jgi:Type IV Pilus-assembly protein W
LVGYEGNDDIGNITVGSSTAQRVTATDAILIKRAAIEDNKLRAIAAHNTATFELTLSGTPPNGIKEKDIAVACDSVSAAIFQVSADSANAISHGIKPFNCTTSLGFPAQPDCSAPIVKSFATGGFAAPYEPVIWYIGNNSAGRKSLYRATLVVNSGGDGASFNPAEMVEDVVDLQLDYLTYTKAAVPTMATDWVKADDAKFAAASGGFGPTNNQQIVAVRAILTFNSQETIGNDGTGAKKVERKTMSVIGLRNRDIRETL